MPAKTTQQTHNEIVSSTRKIYAALNDWVVIVFGLCLSGHNDTLR